MLEGPPGLVPGMAGQMDLAVFADDLALAVHQDRGVEPPLAAARLPDQFRVAEIEADAQFRRQLEQRAHGRIRHFGLVEGIEFGFLLQVPAREEAGERELGEDHDLRAPGMGLAHHLRHAGDAGLARLLAGDGPHLGGGDA